MIKTTAVAVLVASCIGVASPVDAQTMPKRKPGLWETQMTTGGGGGANMPNMQEQLANMSPEQRAQVEAIMKQRGISMGAQGNTMTARFCLSEKDAADESAKSLLSRTVVSRSASEIKMHAVCKTDKGPSEFDIRVYDITPVSMAMELNGKSAERGEMHVQQKMRWVGADCGAVK